jgi:hypothetical protein
MCPLNYENNPQDTLYRLIYYSKSALHISGDVYTPHNLHSSVSTHSGHHPTATWVNTTKYCNYSQVFMMMGENIARNM